MRHYFKYLAFMLLQPWALHASDVRTNIVGEFTQGSLIVIDTSVDAKVYVDGEPVKVYPHGPEKYYNGIAYVGFGRDDPPGEVKIKIEYSDGATEYIKRTLKKREYDIQHLKLPEKMVTPPKEVQQRIADDVALIKSRRDKITQPCHFKGKFLKPAEGRISGVYGSQRILNDKPKNPHMGLDIAANTGEPIVAPEQGVVTMVHDMYYTGNTVLIDHGCGVNTVYAHLSRVDVKEGQRVNAGEKIGEIGATGRATGPHLHWGVDLEGLKLDPELPMNK